MQETTGQQRQPAVGVRMTQIPMTEVGKIDGAPLFHFRGYPSSRLEVLLLAEPAAQAGVRLIGLDRPGIGRSDKKPGFQIKENCP